MSPVAPAAPHGWRISVPASTSNLGPGFDLVGLALDLYLHVHVRRIPGEAGCFFGLRETHSREWPDDASNLLLASFEQTYRELGGAASRFEFDVRSEIPVSRGLGSSGAAVIAGIQLACAVLNVSLPPEELLRRALVVEGHPDNVSPALLGGCVLSVPGPNGTPWIVRQALHESLGFAVAWPSATLETKFARSLLPAQVDFSDARENPRRLALLLEGLRTADAQLLRAGGHDRLHVRFRLPHIPGGAAALEAAQAAGAWLATISGSGSALFAISARSDADRVAAAMRAEFDRAAGPAGGRATRTVDAFARAEPVPSAEAPDA